MPHSYNADYTPPFPVIPVAIREPEASAVTPTLMAFIDTGADGTLVPEFYLQNLIAYKSHAMLIRSHWGETRKVAVYVVDVEVAGHNLPAVEVVADDRGAEILLGRNILNRLILLLDGVRNVTDVLTRRPTRL